MRISILVCSLLVLSGLAAAQAAVIGGTAGTWGQPFVYAAPFIPLVTTPSYSWSSTPAASVSWSNGAGARNSTIEAFAGESRWHYDGFHQVREEMFRENVREGHEGMERREESKHEHAFRSGIGSSDFSESAAQLMSARGSSKKAARTFTNDDVQKMNDNNGNVKYQGKTEHI